MFSEMDTWYEKEIQLRLNTGKYIYCHISISFGLTKLILQGAWEGKKEEEANGRRAEKTFPYLCF